MSTSTPRIPSANGEPAWEAAYMLPVQGSWTEEDFLRFQSNRMAELVDGRLEILPTPTWLHQLIVAFLLERIHEYLRATKRGGQALMAPLLIRLFAGTIREPDLVYVRVEHLPKDVRGYPDKIDMAIEVVSSGKEAHQRDYIDKRVDYARAGVAEFWIVDPEESLVTVLVLNGTEYEVAQECRLAGNVQSVLLSGFEIPVDSIWALAKSAPG